MQENLFDTLEQKIRSLTAAEIIMAMVNGLKKPYTKIAMHTFGEIEKDVCFGCAATNAVCEINNGKDIKEIVSYYYDLKLNCPRPFVGEFESAINNLRLGFVSDYNYAAKEFGFAQIKDLVENLPVLDNHFRPEHLFPYEQLAALQ